ncbi:hypothetical protein HAT91_00178 [Dickeya solani]|nr:hypothetical protein HAT91_00178 [Dickeya solani]
MSKFSARLRIFPRGLLQLLKKPWRRAPTAVKRILVAHNLLLGDTVMLTPLLAKLRRNYPRRKSYCCVSRRLSRCIA